MSTASYDVVPFVPKAGLIALADTINAEHVAASMAAISTVEHAVRSVMRSRRTRAGAAS